MASGNLVYLSGLGQSIMVINSPDTIYELFEKRSSIYSDRGDSPMLNLYVYQLLGHLADPDRCRIGWDWATTLLHYGKQWRRHRKVMYQKLNLGVVAQYQPIQIKHTWFIFHPQILEADIFIE